MLSLTPHRVDFSISRLRATSAMACLIVFVACDPGTLTLVGQVLSTTESEVCFSHESPDDVPHPPCLTITQDSEVASVEEGDCVEIKFRNFENEVITLRKLSRPCESPHNPEEPLREQSSGP